MFSPRVRSCPLNISWTAQPFSFFYIPNLIWWCVIMRQCVMRKNWFTIFNLKVTVRAYIIKISLFLLLNHLNCWSVCKQTWYNRTASYAWVSCGKIGLLHSGSSSQQKFKIVVNVCLDDILWTTEHFVTKPGMVMQRHKPECHAQKLVHCLQCQGHSEGLYNQNMTIFYCIF